MYFSSMYCFSMYIVLACDKLALIRDMQGFYWPAGATQNFSGEERVTAVIPKDRRNV